MTVEGSAEFSEKYIEMLSRKFISTIATTGTIKGTILSHQYLHMTLIYSQF